ncbi:Uncharacterized protein OBRU01_08463 [Operophtera brumata]|uniref:Uncharacterized protein n=1 Tax=Operophtera brumata TaxID=104452 RepID=A0A0L7KZX4_OPEBR|nr:Uncharacterized protein OBRU01_08463 [Operophtera brumata]
MTDSDAANKNSCRICLSSKKALCPLFRYKLSGNYAEMLTAIADVKVAAKDGLPEKICNKCCTTLEKAYLLKTVAERSDRKLRKLLAKGKLNVSTKKIAFDSFTDVKSEIPFSIKPEPKWEMEIDLNNVKPNDAAGLEGKDLIIANTVIRKVDPNCDDIKLNDATDTVDLTWTKTSACKSSGSDFLDDPYQDDDDDDYVPPVKEKPKKYKKTRQVESTTYKGRPIVRKIKVLRKIKDDFDPQDGAPILLKRPKDSTILKVQPGAYKVGTYKRRPDGTRVIKCERPLPRVVRSAAPKQREKLVCPVCGILTQCPKTFTQKSNLLVHSKQHTGVKDHICEICGAGFYSQKSLVRYVYTISIVLFYLWFILLKSNLLVHSKQHTGVKDHICEICGAGFYSQKSLVRYVYTISIVLFYLWFILLKSNLLVHSKQHTGVKDHICEICGAGFYSQKSLVRYVYTISIVLFYLWFILLKSNLLVHSKQHTGVCNVAFSYKVNLNNHVFKVHGINLKFKSIHTVTEDILRREMGMMSETRAAIAHIMPTLGEAPPAAAHETVPHHSEY